MQKNIFIFDQNKCVGCHACVIACMNENGFQKDHLRNIHKSQEHHFPEIPLFYLSLACNHCDDAPCLKNCPALAYSRDEKTGAVIHHPEKCIGCKFCTWACPYDAPKYNPKNGIIEKCTFCNHRIEEGLKPSCTNLCPTGALDFRSKEYSREESKKSSPVPVDVGAKIEIKNLRNINGPEIDLNLFKDQPKEFRHTEKSQKISAKEEWPLVIFTLLSSFLVSYFAAGKTEQFSYTSKIIFMIIASITALLSMLHLGKKQRVWRSVLNIKQSWLSKEIVAFSLFFITLFIDSFFISLSKGLIIFFGILLLFSIDMLYQLATWKWPLKIHSAQTIFIGTTLYAFFSEHIYTLAFITAFRLTIYIYKSYRNSEKWIVNLARISCLLLGLYLLILNQNPILGLAIIVLGEIIDRTQFYDELNVPDPNN